MILSFDIIIYWGVLKTFGLYCPPTKSRVGTTLTQLSLCRVVLQSLFAERSYDTLFWAISKRDKSEGARHSSVCGFQPALV